MTLSMIVLATLGVGLATGGLGAWRLLRRDGARWQGWALIAGGVMLQAWWVALLGLFLFKTLVLKQDT